MPLDIFYDIASFLDIWDFIYLSRTCKQLNKLLSEDIFCSLNIRVCQGDVTIFQIPFSIRINPLVNRNMPFILSRPVLPMMVTSPTEMPTDVFATEVTHLPLLIPSLLFFWPTAEVSFTDRV